MSLTAVTSAQSTDTQSLLRLLATKLGLSEQAIINLALTELAQSRQLAIGDVQPTTASMLPDPPSSSTDETSDAVAGSE